MIIKRLHVSAVSLHFKWRLTLLTIPSSVRLWVSQRSCYESATHLSGPRLRRHVFYNALKISAKPNLFTKGQHLHADIIKLGYHDKLSLQNQLLNFYVKCKRFPDACKLFDEMLDRNVVTWNTLICGLAESFRDFSSNIHPGFQYFKRMMMEIARPDWITFFSLFRICADVKETEMSRVLHCLVLKWGFCRDCFVSSALVDMYGKLGLVAQARRVFDDVVARDLVIWNVIISCYSFNCLREEASKLYKLMRSEGFKGDEYTFTSLLSCCASSGLCQFGMEIHAVILKLCFNFDVVVASSLLDMYAKNGDLTEARKAFDEMPFRNVVSWTTLVVGYGHHGNRIEAIKLLVEMLREDFHPDEITLASILSSCGNLTLFGEITQVHAFVCKNGFSPFSSIANAMIVAYFKCGSITCALQIFNSITEPDLLSWTSIIGAYSFHGLPDKAIELFETMLLNRIKPDGIAFLEVLCACSHGGLVEKGLHYFRLMVDVYKIVPDSKHYACLVDLLARKGLLKEAFNVLTSTPSVTGSDALGAFLSSCKVHGNIELAKWASQKLFILEPNEPVNYALLSNMYASPGHWFDVARVRKTMRESCYNKAPGCSWLQISGNVSSFVSGDESHPEAAKVYYILEVLYKTMKEERMSPEKALIDGCFCEGLYTIF